MSARVAVHVTPRSSRNEIAGWRGGELLVRVTVPPEDGKANAAVCKLLAKALGVPRSAVHVARGEVSRHKQLQIDGVEQPQLDDLLGEPGPGPR